MKKKWMQQLNQDELQIEILQYIGYEHLLEKVILISNDVEFFSLLLPV